MFFRLKPNQILSFEWNPGVLGGFVFQVSLISLVLQTKPPATDVAGAQT